MNNGQVIFHTSAQELKDLLNDSDRAYSQAGEIEALKSECQALKQQLVFIGKEVYETDGKHNVWSTAGDKPESNDALKYAKSLADKESK